MKIKIKEPIWKNRSVGVAASKLVEDKIEIEILYKDKVGNRVFPGIHEMPSIVAKSYPVQIKKGCRLHIIPIRAFRVKNG